MQDKSDILHTYMSFRYIIILNITFKVNYWWCKKKRLEHFFITDVSLQISVYALAALKICY